MLSYPNQLRKLQVVIDAAKENFPRQTDVIVTTAGGDPNCTTKVSAYLIDALIRAFTVDVSVSAKTIAAATAARNTAFKECLEIVKRNNVTASTCNSSPYDRGVATGRRQVCSQIEEAIKRLLAL